MARPGEKKGPGDAWCANQFSTRQHYINMKFASVIAASAVLAVASAASSCDLEAATKCADDLDCAKDMDSSDPDCGCTSSSPIAAPRRAAPPAARCALCLC